MEALGEHDPQHAVVDRLSTFLDATVTLFRGDGTVVESIGEAPGADDLALDDARPATVV